MNFIQRIPGRAYLIIGVLIFAAANSVTRQLTVLGSQYLIEGRNPISFCNVLLVGNVWALMILILIYYQELRGGIFKQFSSKDWLALSGVALLSGALAPALFFAGLERTMVNNVILISRIEPPLTLALSVWLLHERINRWVLLGAILSFLGVGLTLLIPSAKTEMIEMAGFQIGIGELMVAGGAIAAAIATIISKFCLQNIPLGVFSIYRTFLGSLIFFSIVLKLFGWHHFMDVFSPVVWQWMFFYSAVIVVGGQFCWFMGLKKTSASEVSFANSFHPIAGILAAYLILGEVPNPAQYIGGSVIILGIIFNQIGIARVPTESPSLPPSDQSAEQLDRSVGFKGI